ncbi:hypothetical protein PILCRDRAFT_12275 [Piloderma croceum F 1598]|uniref:Uncharacterized protein n=1 Tax=Piloderma croceum (strain F 1598) TaxID=765440 RepID=A0A0C3EX65_PILCF|nr:hypothetical protein PILCRDRAFT_12275 [Piloderma croceum F 1598]
MKKIEQFAKKFALFLEILITDHMSHILGNEDGHDDGRREDDNEDESVESSDEEEASDTPATKARRLTDK